MDGRRRRVVGASLVTMSALALAAAPAALAAPGVAVSSVSSLAAGANAGTLSGTVVNDTNRATRAAVTVRLMRRGTEAPVVGRTAVQVGAHGSAAYSVNVKLPSSLARGNYYLSACTVKGDADKGKLGCATAEREVLAQGGIPVRGSAISAQFARAAHASAAEDCKSGAHTLSTFGQRVYPETGNGGYLSLRSDVYLAYNGDTNMFLPGTHVDLQQRSTQCLTDFSLDFERSNADATAGPNMTVNAVKINGQPVSFKFVQPTYPGDPNGQDDPDPAAHAASLTNPVSATNPNPPACTIGGGTRAPVTGAQCPANKLVITPTAPIPSGTTFTVTVEYTGRPGVHLDGDNTTEGWFRSNSPVGDGSFVTTEPVGTMAWMPLNNHPSVKPMYDFYDTVEYDPALVTPNGDGNRTGIANGRLVDTTTNAPDANFAKGSKTFHWTSDEPIASYLVENSIAHFDLSSRIAPSGVVYYEAQGSSISTNQKATNKAIMDQQEDITLFQTRFNGTFPFSSNGVIVGIPSASFEEEMQTKITFQGGSISLGTFNHENMHQWWGDNVSEAGYHLTFFKEGMANLSQSLQTARTAATNAGGLDTPAGDAAFEASLVSTFNSFYNATSTAPWSSAPSNPTSGNLFNNNVTYTRPARGYIALRAILGKSNWVDANKEIQTTYRGGSITEPQLIAVFHKHMPNQSQACSDKLDAFFKQWWDTVYTGPPAAGNKPAITGPGLAGGGFYDANGNCSDYQYSAPGGTVPATLSLSLGAAANFAQFTPGVAKDYTSSTTATVISSAGDATLSVADASTNVPGHLVNGAFSLPAALKAAATSAGGASAGQGTVSGAPLALETWSGPASNDVSTVTFTQPIGAGDALRTGTYSKTLTFTLSTTNP
jgi:hypothetical protein